MIRIIINFVVLCSLAGWSMVGVSQTLVSGWQEASVHGPSQLGISDTIPVDFNQNGMLDVVSVSLQDGQLRAYLNQGNLQFEEQVITTDLFGAFRLTPIHFNEDGEVDFIIPSIETQEIIAVISEPGGYQKKIIAEGVLLPTDAQADLINNDDLLDVVSISFEENLLLLHQQKVNGEFDTLVISETLLRPRKLVLEDFNNDDLIDILVASSEDNTVRLFENSGSEGFVETVISDQIFGARYISSCHVNDDQMIDFVAAAADINSIIVFTNNGGMGFTQQVLDADVTGVNDLLCYDLDGDQQQELISLAGSIGVIYTHELVGAPSRRVIASTRDGYAVVQAGEFMDSQVSILTQSFFENRNLLYDPFSTNLEHVVWEDFPDGASDVKMGDINADGVIDLVASSFRDDRVQWYDGLTLEHHIIAEGVDGAAEVLVVDLDGDDLMDVLSAASFANTFYWHRNMGSEQFETITIFNGAAFANGLAVGDINQDGKLDVIGTSGTDDSVRWFDRTGQVFTMHLIDDQNDAPNEVKLQDLDGDSDLDLLVPYTFSDQLVMYENLGGGIFTANLIAPGLDQVDSTVLNDFNTDGLIDILVSVAGDDEVLKLTNQSLGLFTVEPLIEQIPNPKKLKLNTTTPYNFMLATYFPDGIETVSIFNLDTPSGGFGDLLFEFSHAVSTNSHIYLTSLQDLIYAGGFE